MQLQTIIEARVVEFTSKGTRNMSRIENHKYSIEEAFNECFYIVPDYQREYTWGEREVSQLLEDINEQAGNGNDVEYLLAPF